MPPHGSAVSANDRLKQRYPGVLAAGIVASVSIHALAILLAPSALIDRYLVPSGEMRLLGLPDLPSGSEPVERRTWSRAPYGVPIPASEPLEDVPRPPPPVEPPPMDPVRTVEELLEGPTETPHDIAPQLSNPRAVVDRLRAFYPPLRWVLGVDARLQIWCLIDDRGAIRRVLIRESSGYDDVDEAVLRAADFMEFTPALSGGRGVPVWISLPIVFRPDPFGGG